VRMLEADPSDEVLLRKGESDGG